MRVAVDQISMLLSQLRPGMNPRGQRAFFLCLSGCLSQRFSPRSIGGSTWVGFAAVLLVVVVMA